jgi:hypothetical protein
LAKIPTNKMDEAWKKRLDEKLALELRNRPELRKLRARLLRVGGEEALVNDIAPAEVRRLLNHGKLWTSEPILNPMHDNQCHSNSRILMELGLGQVASGYGLTPDGLWRPHSWVIDFGTVIETTTPRVAYYGVILTRQEVQDEIDL